MMKNQIYFLFYILEMKMIATIKFAEIHIDFSISIYI